MADRPSLSVAVMAHPRREPFVAELVEAIDRPAKVVWDERNDRWDTGRRSLLAYDPSCTHHLVVQDDAVVCRDLAAGVEQALAQVPAKPGTPTPLGLYVGRVTPFRHQVTQLATDAGDTVSWLTIGRVLWGVAVVMPTPLIDRMVAWGDSGGRFIANYDARIGRWLDAQRITTWYPWPSLVDHRDSPSLVAGHDAPGRRAHRFIGTDASALDLDWSGDVIHVPSLGRYGRPGKPLRRPRSTKEEPMPPTTVSGEVLIACKNAMVTIDGRRRRIRRGETTAHPDSWIAQTSPHLWQPIPIDFPAGQDPADETSPQPATPPAPEGDADHLPATQPDAGDPPVDPDPAPPAKDVRAWAKAQGIDVPSRGPLPDDVVGQYKAAHTRTEW